MHEINISGAKIVLDPNKCDYAIYLRCGRSEKLTMGKSAGMGDCEACLCVCQYYDESLERAIQEGRDRTPTMLV